MRQDARDRRPLLAARPWRQLVHELNQRYHREFDRAERLQAELDAIRESRAWRMLEWLRRCRRWVMALSTSQPAPPPVDWECTGVELLKVQPVRVSALAVSVVIPLRDQTALLRNCLASLRQNTHGRYDVVLVDNGSRAASTLRLLSRLEMRQRYRVVRDPAPFNFARLANRGAAAANGEYLLFLNNDVEAASPDWLERMLEVACQPGVGVVGATLLYPDLTIQHAGLTRNLDVWAHVYRGVSSDHSGRRGELRAVRTVPAVTGACLLIRRELFARLGGFDERLAVTHNDVDLCQRAWRLGQAVAITPHARLYHFESLSRGYRKEANWPCSTT